MDGQLTTEHGSMSLVELEKEMKTDNGKKKEFTTEEAVLSKLWHVAFCLLFLFPLSIMVLPLLMECVTIFADKMRPLLDMLPPFEFRYAWEMMCHYLHELFF